MKVWCFDRYGAPASLSMEERAMPSPAAGEVLVRVHAAGINPSDVKNVAGAFHAELPRVPGRDYAGVIVAGAGREGEEVYGSAPGFGVTRDGSHAEYLVLPSAWVSAKPKNLSMAQGASVGVPYLAAWFALVQTGDLRKGETLLVTGVLGAVGNAATQIARDRGARVIGADLSPASMPGADAVIDVSHAPLGEEIARLTGGRGVDLVLDTVGGALFEPALQSLRTGGRQVAIASNPPVVSFNLVDFYHGCKRLAGVDTMKLSGEEVAQTMDALREGFERGALSLPELRTWPFEEAVQAYEAVARRDPPVKHVLEMVAPA